MEDMIAGAGAHALCHVTPPSLLCHTLTFDDSTLLTIERKTVESPMQSVAVAQAS
jgi:hypothetical protein